jgi:hypothetical protein
MFGITSMRMSKEGGKKKKNQFCTQLQFYFSKCSFLSFYMKKSIAMENFV